MKGIGLAFPWLLKARRRTLLSAVFLILAVLLPMAGEAGEPASPLADEPLQPLARPAALNPGIVALGRRLFHDPILSADDSISCATCHNLSTGGAGRRAHATGINGAVGPVKAPTVYNSGFNFAQFWDGRASSLEAQVGGPLTNATEMGANWPEVLGKLGADPSYVRAFQAAFGTGPTEEAVREAIATFERSLVTVGSRFDRYLGGEATALTECEREGYRLFKAYGCASCHQGANVGGNMFEKFGFMGNPFTDHGHPEAVDLGRYNLTQRDSDRFVFKVPSLRLAAVNPPYFHNGSAADLPEAIRVMGHYQLGREIPERDVNAIAAFLGSLVGVMEGP